MAQLLSLVSEADPLYGDQYSKDQTNLDTYKIAEIILSFTIDYCIQAEQSDLGLHSLSRPVCPKTWDHYGEI